jgi:methionyl-tRNA formyltransferase
MSMMRAIFFGTPAIAVPALDALASVATIVGVVCQPDRPAGRGLALRPPPVKVRALELGLAVVQPTTIRTEPFAAWMAQASADVALVMAYGRILPKPVLTAPRRGCMNLHASLLPKYRGAAPIAWAIVNGERETGISLMQMDEGCDTGPVYSRHALSITETMTAADLAEELGRLAAAVVRSDLARAVRGEIEPVAQVDRDATLARMLTKADGHVDWARSAREVHNHVRGMTPWPGAVTTSEGKTLKLLEARVAKETGDLGEPGLVLSEDPRAIVVACGAGALQIVRAQLEGRKPLDAAELLSGRAVTIGGRLGAST